MKMSKFYFCYKGSECPFESGYTLVFAQSVSQAEDIFNQVYPQYIYTVCYTEQEAMERGILKEGFNGHRIRDSLAYQGNQRIIVRKTFNEDTYKPATAKFFFVKENLELER